MVEAVITARSVADIPQVEEPEAIRQAEPPKKHGFGRGVGKALGFTVRAGISLVVAGVAIGALAAWGGESLSSYGDQLTGFADFVGKLPDPLETGIAESIAEGYRAVGEIAREPAVFAQDVGEVGVDATSVFLKDQGHNLNLGDLSPFQNRMAAYMAAGLALSPVWRTPIWAARAVFWPVGATIGLVGKGVGAGVSLARSCFSQKVDDGELEQDCSEKEGLGQSIGKVLKPVGKYGKSVAICTLVFGAAIAGLSEFVANPELVGQLGQMPLASEIPDVVDGVQQFGWVPRHVAGVVGSMDVNIMDRHGLAALTPDSLSQQGRTILGYLTAGGVVSAVLHTPVIAADTVVGTVRKIGSSVGKAFRKSEAED